MDVREALLRLAGQLERPVEMVEHSDALLSLGGVGCLLRTPPVSGQLTLNIGPLLSSLLPLLHSDGKLDAQIGNLFCRNAWRAFSST